jgi:hypothetical protein
MHRLDQRLPDCRRDSTQKLYSSSITAETGVNRAELVQSRTHVTIAGEDVIVGIVKTATTGSSSLISRDYHLFAYRVSSIRVSKCAKKAL